MGKRKGTDHVIILSSQKIKKSFKKLKNEIKYFKVSLLSQVMFFKVLLLELSYGTSHRQLLISGAFCG